MDSDGSCDFENDLILLGLSEYYEPGLIVHLGNQIQVRDMRANKS